jgi:hypothetical protein
MRALLCGLAVGWSQDLGGPVAKAWLWAVSATGIPDTAVLLLALIGGATTDAAGDVVLHLSGNHEVTLQGIGLPALRAGLLG